MLFEDIGYFFRQLDQGTTLRVTVFDFSSVWPDTALNKVVFDVVCDFCKQFSRESFVVVFVLAERHKLHHVTLGNAHLAAC